MLTRPEIERVLRSAVVGAEARLEWARPYADASGITSAQAEAEALREALRIVRTYWVWLDDSRAQAIARREARK